MQQLFFICLLPPLRRLQPPPSLLAAYLCDGVPQAGWSDSFVLSQPF